MIEIKAYEHPRFGHIDGSFRMVRPTGTNVRRANDKTKMCLRQPGAHFSAATRIGELGRDCSLIVNASRAARSCAFDGRDHVREIPGCNGRSNLSKNHGWTA